MCQCAAAAAAAAVSQPASQTQTGCPHRSDRSDSDKTRRDISTAAGDEGTVTHLWIAQLMTRDGEVVVAVAVGAAVVVVVVVVS